MQRMTLRPFAALVAFLLSACAGAGQDGRFPALTKRPVETQSVEEEVLAPDIGTAPQADDPALDRKLAELTDQAMRGGAMFDRLYNEVAGRIRLSASAGVSSEQWVAAQVNLGRLEQARHDSVYALAGLDTLYVERMDAVAAGKAAGGLDRIGAARTDALALVDSQNDRVDALRAMLKAP